MYAERLAETLPRVRDAMADAALGAGRDPDGVRLVAVTKGHPLDAVTAALDAGVTDLGENRVGELEEKVRALGEVVSDEPDVRWHMIGHLQRRKAPRAIEAAHLIHSVDSLRLAERLSRVATRAERVVPVLLQVNTSGEDAKGGFDWPDGFEALLEAARLDGLDVGGLMTMAPLTQHEGTLRSTFERCRRWSEELRAREPSVGPELSMGMTNDLAVAIEEGSTMVRIGTALFGERGGTQ